MRTMTRWLAVFAIAALTAAPATAQNEEKATGDGIKVHGHWTIEVKNADGSLASHDEFENALILNGAMALSTLLAHDTGATVLGWSITFGDLSFSCCKIAEPAVAQALPFGGFNSTNLTVSRGNTAEVVLQGSVQANVAAGFSIGSVSSGLIVQQTGGSFTGGTFSERILAQAIPIQSGQIVQVTVHFTFS